MRCTFRSFIDVHLFFRPPGTCELCLGVWTRSLNEATPRSVTQETEKADDLTSCLSSGRNTSSFKSSAHKHCRCLAWRQWCSAKRWATRYYMSAEIVSLTWQMCTQMSLLWKTECLKSQWSLEGNYIHKNFKWQNRTKAKQNKVMW